MTAYNPLLMQYQILVQNQNKNGVVASVIGMPECKAEGKTKEEAIANIKQALKTFLAQGEIVSVEIPTPVENPLLKHAGRFKDDETFDDFLAEIEKYRREVDEAEAAREDFNQISKEAA